MQIKWTHIILITILIITCISCKKGSVETDYNPSLTVANNQVIAERAYSQVFNIFFMVVSDSVLNADGSDTVFGAHCTYEEVPEIKYTIDYLHYYTSCPDGKRRKGVINVTLNKDFSETGAIANLSFLDYTVDSLRLEGDNLITNSGISASMSQIYEHTIPSATLTLINLLGEQPYHWESQKAYTYVGGMGTPNDFSDDLFMISGHASGISINGVNFTSTIDEPLGNYFDCRWVRTGKALLSIPGQEINSGYIDYIGEDTCTDQVVYYFNGNPFYERFIYH